MIGRSLLPFSLLLDEDEDAVGLGLATTPETVELDVKTLGPVHSCIPSCNSLPRSRREVVAILPEAALAPAPARGRTAAAALDRRLMVYEWVSNATRRYKDE